MSYQILHFQGLRITHALNALTERQCFSNLSHDEQKKKWDFTMSAQIQTARTDGPSNIPKS